MTDRLHVPGLARSRPPLTGTAARVVEITRQGHVIRGLWRDLDTAAGLYGRAPVDGTAFAYLEICYLDGRRVVS